jgi:KDO2-lipid IV(A) lauroyltransferase
MTILFRSPRMGALEPLLRQVRERFGAKLVATTAGGIRALFRALAAGEAVGMLPDQEPRKGTGVFAPFFGVPAYTMVLLSRLARTRRSPVIFAFMERLPAGKGYRLHYFPAPDDIYDPDPAVSATAMNRTVQACIAMNPAQYLWSYKRFRLRPNDGRSPYKAVLLGSDSRDAGDFLH